MATTAEKMAFIEGWFTVGRDPQIHDRVGRREQRLARDDVGMEEVSRVRCPAGKYPTLFRPDFVDTTRVMLGLAKKGDVAAYQAVARALGENAPEKV
jgi:hypothetical protein